MSQANVRSLDSIKDFRTALVNFAEDARNALSGVDMEIRQFRNWLERDQLTYWKGQVKKCTEAVAAAKSELHRRQLSQANSESVSDADQKEALRVAKRRLQEAEQKVEKIKKMIPVLEHAIAEYNSASQPLGDRLAGGLVGSIALLDRMIIAVERYLALQAPTTAASAPGGGNDVASSGAPGKAASAANGAPAEAAAPAAATTTAATEPAQAQTQDAAEIPVASADGAGLNPAPSEPTAARAN